MNSPWRRESHVDVYVNQTRYIYSAHALWDQNDITYARH